MSNEVYNAFDLYRLQNWGTKVLHYVVKQLANLDLELSYIKEQFDT
jgi:hypothetical protein